MRVDQGRLQGLIATGLIATGGALGSASKTGRGVQGPTPAPGALTFHTPEGAKSGVEEHLHACLSSIVWIGGRWCTPIVAVLHHSRVAANPALLTVRSPVLAAPPVRI